MSVSPIQVLPILVPVILLSQRLDPYKSQYPGPIPLITPYARHANLHSSCRTWPQQPPKRDSLGRSRYVLPHPVSHPYIPLISLSLQKATKSSLPSPSRTSTHKS